MDVRPLQKVLGVTADGIPGIGTFTALFKKCGASDESAAELAIAANRYFPEYGIMDSPLRLSHFMAQAIHESGSFRYMEEIWGPTAAQKGYEGRKDLGNVNPGDGTRYKGRGVLQLTGRANYRAYGRTLGIDIERHPELAAIPSISLHIALEYWKKHNLNDLADANDLEAITRRVNGGLNGLTDRKNNLVQIKGWLS